MQGRTLQYLGHRLRLVNEKQWEDLMTEELKSNPDMIAIQLHPYK